MVPSDEPPIREFADRGVLWLLESPQNLADLLRLLTTELAARLDFTRAQRLNRSFVPPTLHKQEADLLYQVPFADADARRPEILLYVLVEHQSEPDEEMGLRLLSYLVQVWEMQRRQWQQQRTPRGERRLFPIVPLVFYTGTRRWDAVPGVGQMMELPALCARFVPVHDTLFLNLQATDADTLQSSAVGWALRALQSVEASQAVLEEVLAAAVEYLEGLPPQAQAEWRRAMQFLLLLILHKRAPHEQEALREVVVASATKKHQEEVREMAMTGAQFLEEKGRQEGRQEGKHEGQRLLLLALLEQKFGPLPEETVSQVQALSEAQLTQLGVRLLTAQTLAELPEIAR